MSSEQLKNTWNFKQCSEHKCNSQFLNFNSKFVPTRDKAPATKLFFPALSSRKGIKEISSTLYPSSYIVRCEIVEYIFGAEGRDRTDDIWRKWEDSDKRHWREMDFKRERRLESQWAKKRRTKWKLKAYVFRIDVESVTVIYRVFLLPLTLSPFLS